MERIECAGCGRVVYEDVSGNCPECNWPLSRAKKTSALPPPRKPLSIDAGPPRVGVCVLVWCEGRILLGKRKGSHGAGLWSVPGGKIEGDEPAWWRAYEEVKEETDLRVAPFLGRPGWVHSIWQDPDKGPQNWVTLYFEAEIRDPKLVKLMEPDKCECWQWHDPLALPEGLFLPLQNFVDVYPPETWRFSNPKISAARQANESGLCAEPGCGEKYDPRWFLHVNGRDAFQACDGHGCERPHRPCSGCGDGR